MTVDLYPPGVTDSSPDLSGDALEEIITEIHEAFKGFVRSGRFVSVRLFRLSQDLP